MQPLAVYTFPFVPACELMAKGCDLCRTWYGDRYQPKHRIACFKHMMTSVPKHGPTRDLLQLIVRCLEGVVLLSLSLICQADHGLGRKDDAGFTHATFSHVQSELDNRYGFGSLHTRRCTSRTFSRKHVHTALNISRSVSRAKPAYRITECIDYRV